MNHHNFAYYCSSYIQHKKSEMDFNSCVFDFKLFLEMGFIMDCAAMLSGLPYFGMS